MLERRKNRKTSRWSLKKTRTGYFANEEEHLTASLHSVIMGRTEASSIRGERI